MNLIQTPLDRRRGWKSLREIGSPWRLARLVRELSAHERTKHRATKSDEFKAQGAKSMEATRKQLRSYLGLLSMKRTAAHYVARMAMPPSVYAVDDTLDRHVREYQRDGTIDLALEAAGSVQSPDFGVRVLAVRKRELEQGIYAPESLDPGDLDVGTDAFEVYRRGAVLEATGSGVEARRMYTRALESDPAFPMALRRLAGLERSRSPAAAAALYSEALDFMPKEDYGEAGVLHVLDVYRNFLLTKRDGEFVAIPVSVGKVDFSSARLRSAVRRFAGLFLMRLRLRVSGIPASASAAAPAIDAGAVRQIAAVQDRQSAGINTASSVAASKSGSTATSLVKTMSRFPVRWVARHMDLFHFVLAGVSIDDLKIQIDKVDREWLSRTAAV
jgi:tetratricopeptide (TPR) repeat protein